jgi:hypothetical protein|tara:strand:- start:24 stop:1373 length:1350 start_codon:yes stop_codon:yes gene_type:complete
MFMSESLQEKWQPVLEHPDLPKIEDSYKRAVTSVILENQERAMREESGALNEALGAGTGTVVGTGATATAANWDPILISLVRRAMPNLVAYDICGVQPMTGPTGLIFAMKARYVDSTSAVARTEALFNEADTDFSATGTHAGADPFAASSANAAIQTGYTTGSADATATAEIDASIAEMSFTIEKATVTAKSRALKAEYTIELAQDLKAIHGLDAETELANILSGEILAEINREVVRTVNDQAKIEGVASEANLTGTSVNGQFNLDVDSSGRWSVEKFKGLMYHIERNANVIARQTRRGKGNFILCSSDVASALAMAGVLDYAPALSTNLNVDDTGNTFAGVLNGSLKVYIDPYYASVSTRPTGVTAGEGYCTVGYRGSNPFDAGLFYCPYVPLQMVRAVGENTFQPKIGFKTRYGMVSNPFVGATPANGMAATSTNSYYRSFEVLNLL